MDKFNEIDYESWDRKEIYDRFVPCLYTITAELDITKMIKSIREKNIKFYPTIIYCVAKVCNAYKEYRFANLNGKIGYFDVVHPIYTVPRKGTELFTHKMTSWNENFTEFYEAFLADNQKAINATSLYCDENLPRNLVAVTVLPDLVITGLDYNSPISAEGVYVPFVTFGKFREVNEKIMISAGIQFRHEVNDGYHVNKFYKELEKVCNNLFS